jgi:hypothetical protein
VACLPSAERSGQAAPEKQRRSDAIKIVDGRFGWGYDRRAYGGNATPGYAPLLLERKDFVLQVRAEGLVLCWPVATCRRSLS